MHRIEKYSYETHLPREARVDFIWTSLELSMYFIWNTNERRTKFIWICVCVWYLMQVTVEDHVQFTRITQEIHINFCWEYDVWIRM